jgi:hypothetical protein
MNEPTRTTPRKSPIGDGLEADEADARSHALHFGLFVRRQVKRESWEWVGRCAGTGRSSITLSIEVWTLRQGQGARILVTDAVFTFVAVDDEGRPRPIAVAS